jgi:hypothetical protein
MDDLSNHPNQASTRQVWAKDDLYVSVSRTVGGGLSVDGQDANPNPFGDSDYEYTVTVGRDDVPKVIEALGGQQGDDPLALIEANIDSIVRTGEMTWLKSIGVSPGFSSYP